MKLRSLMTRTLLTITLTKENNMKTFFVTIIILVASISQARDKYPDKNIVSFVVGEGPSSIDSSGTPASSNSSSSTSSSTSTSSPTCHSHCGGEDDVVHGSPSTTTNNNTTNTSNSLSPARSNPSQERGVVTGLLYQRRIADSPLLIGVLIQSNKTYSALMGVSF